MIKIILKTCFFATLFINQSFSQAIPQNSSQNNVYIAEKLEKTAQFPSAHPKTETFLSQPPKIVSSINPIYQIAKFISDDEKNNFLLINPRASERDYQFRSSNINTLNDADVVFYISDNLEYNLPQALISLKKNPKIIQLIKSKNMQLLTFQLRANEENIDTHIWLNPENAIIIATEIAETLSQLYPKESGNYKKKLERFIADVVNMDKQNKLELFKVKQKSFLMDLNSAVYFENYYNMPSAGVIRYTDDQELSFKDIEKINNLIKKEKVVCVLGSYQKRSGLTVQIASNNKIKFALIDIIGGEINDNQNGYVKMMKGLVSDLIQCVQKQ